MTDVLVAGWSLTLEVAPGSLSADGLRRVLGKVYPEVERSLLATGQQTVLPRSREIAGNLAVTFGGGKVRTASMLGVHPLKGGVALSALTGNRKMRRAFGLQEYGGTVKVPLRAKRSGKGHMAISTPWGPRASVTGPRRFQGRHFLTLAVQESVPALRGNLDRDLSDLLQRAVNGV